MELSATTFIGRMVERVVVKREVSGSIQDDEEFTPGCDKGRVITMGEYVEKVLLLTTWGLGTTARLLCLSEIFLAD